MNEDSLLAAGLVPVILGVTGHRDIPEQDVLKLEAVTIVILQDIEALTPNSPHVLISCLAEGADRIAARCAVKIGWSLGVVLPAPTEIYEQDFSTVQSKEEFRTLLSLSSWIESVAIDSSGTSKGVSNYLGAGIRVMQQSQLMVAYWDGKSIGLKGGAGDIVERFLSEIPDTGYGLSGNTPPDARPVIHVMTRRMSAVDSVLNMDLGHYEWLAPKPGGMSGKGEIPRWKEVLRRIDLFNADANQFREENVELVRASIGYLDKSKRDNNSTGSLTIDYCISIFAVCDAMSSVAQKERDRLFYWLAGMATIAIVLEQIYSGLYSASWVLGLSVLIGIFATIFYKYAGSKRIESRYLDYRSLAEACRVQYYWWKAGVPSSVADNFLLEQLDELEWVRQAIRANERSIDVGCLPRQDNLTVFESIRDNWIEDQRHYFVGIPGIEKGNKSEFNRRQYVLWSRRASQLFLAGVFVVLVLVLTKQYFLESFYGNGEFFANALSAIYGLLFSAAGLIKVYQESKAFNEQSKSYRRGGLLMFRASQRLMGAIANSDIALAQRVIYEAGCEALDENGDWLLLHRDRPVQVPI